MVCAMNPADLLKSVVWISKKQYERHMLICDIWEKWRSYHVLMARQLEAIPFSEIAQYTLIAYKHGNGKEKHL